MIEEPRAVKDIHDIRIAIYEEMKGLSLHEKFMRIKKRADEEWERIMEKKNVPCMVTEDEENYGKE